MAFADVLADAYYYKAVLWAVEKGITVGTGEATFSPDMTCTRAQIVTMLWRQESAATVNDELGFDDVTEGDWYAEAVRWAVSEKITEGTGNGHFSPNADCTRAQIVTFLYRNAQ